MQSRDVAVKRRCRVVEEIDIVEAVASESSILVSEYFLMLFGITKKLKTTTNIQDTEHNNSYQM